MQLIDQEEQVEDGSCWVKFYDEPDKRVFYKQEEGLVYGTIMTDCITDAGICETLACYDNFEVLEELMKEFYDLKWLQRRGKANGLIWGKQSYPWPMHHRDITFYASGVLDFKNRGVITVSKSLEPGSSYYGTKVPMKDQKYRRLEIKQGYNYFQYLGPKKTRHISIYNTDPKIKYMPKWLLNYMMTSVSYSNILGLQQKSVLMHDEKFKHSYLMEENKAHYASILEELTTGGTQDKSAVMTKHGIEPLAEGPFTEIQEEEISASA